MTTRASYDIPYVKVLRPNLCLGPLGQHSTWHKANDITIVESEGHGEEGLSGWFVQARKTPRKFFYRYFKT